MPSSFSLDYVAKGLQADETSLPETEEASGPQVDQNALEQLMQMGFTKEASTKALMAHPAVEEAMNWIFTRLDDPTLNDPIPTGGSSGGSADPAKEAELMSMGFSQERVRKALKACVSFIHCTLA